MHRVRLYAKTMDIETAVKEAIDECIAEGILSEFLGKNRAEAISMSIYEYDLEKHIRLERRDAWAEGHAEGHAEGRAEGHAEGHAEGLAQGLKEGLSQAEKRIQELEAKIAILEGKKAGD